MTHQEAGSAQGTDLRARRRATWVIVLGMLTGVAGMVLAFSYPGAALFFVGHAIVILGFVMGRTRRHAAYSILALAVVWLMPFVFLLVNQF